MTKKLGAGAVLAIVVTAGVSLHGCGRQGTPNGATSGASAIAWESDFSVALSRASHEKKIVMLDFYTDWCGWCKRLDQTTLSDPRVQQTLHQLVSIKLNADKEGRAAAQRYRVEGYPTIVFVDGSGSEVGRIPGYMDAGPFLAELEDILHRA
jgi:thiol:disulfide interchange protein